MRWGRGGVKGLSSLPTVNSLSYSLSQPYTLLYPQPNPQHYFHHCSLTLPSNPILYFPLLFSTPIPLPSPTHSFTTPVYTIPKLASYPYPIHIFSPVHLTLTPHTHNSTPPTTCPYQPLSHSPLPIYIPSTPQLAFYEPLTHNFQLLLTSSLVFYLSPDSLTPLNSCTPSYHSTIISYTATQPFLISLPYPDTPCQIPQTLPILPLHPTPTINTSNHVFTHYFLSFFSHPIA